MNTSMEIAAKRSLRYASQTVFDPENELEYASPKVTRCDFLNEYGYLTVGGLYYTRKRPVPHIPPQPNFFMMVIAIRDVDIEYTCTTIPTKVIKIRRFEVDYLVREEMWEWNGRLDQMGGWARSFERVA